MPITWLKTGLLPLSWLVLFAEMTWLRYMTPFGRSPDHPGYGENFPGVLPVEYGISITEVAILLAILRPWTREPIWRRGLVALVLFGTWSVLGGLGYTHGGSIEHAHSTWRLVITLGLMVTVLASVVRHAYHRVTAA